MKALFHFVFCVALVIYASLDASAQWHLTGPTYYIGVHSMGHGHFLVSASNGNIYETKDFGEHWTTFNLDLARTTISISSYDDFHWIVSESDGFVAVTTDAGQHWTESKPSPLYPLSSINFTSADTAFGYTYLGEIYRTTDGGRNWVELAKPTNAHLWELHFFDGQNGITCGDSATVLITSDRGLSWQQVAVPTKGDLLCMDAKNDGRVVVGTSKGEVLLSHDFGEHWEVMKVPYETDSRIGNVAFASGDTIVMFQLFFYNAQPVRYISPDFGQSWRPIAMNPRLGNGYTYELIDYPSITDVDFDDSGNGLAVGNFGTIYRMTNFGLNGGFIRHCSFGAGYWPFDNAGAMFDLPNKGSHTLHIVGAEKGPWAYSTDMGETWMTGLDPNHRGAQYVGLHFTDDTTGTLFTTWAVSPNRHTHNNGDTWGNIANPAGRVHLSTADLDGQLYAIGDTVIYRSTTSGLSWKKYSQYAESDPRTPNRKILLSTFHQLQLFHEPVGFGLVWTFDSLFAPDLAHAEPTYSTAELVVRGEGDSWIKRYEFPLGSLCNGICFVNSALGYALIRDTVADSVSMGWCLRTTDGGYHWTKMDGLSTKTEFREMKFREDGKYGLLLGRTGDIRFSIDSGRTWRHDTLSSVYDRIPQYTKRLYNTFFADDTTVFITSDHGFWKRTINLGTLSTDERSVASLSPYTWMYPYPTPVTGNSFRVHITGLASFTDRANTTLRLYDILGREVADLSREFRSQPVAYTAEIEVDANRLSPGVYVLVLASAHSGGTTARVVIAH